MDDQAQAEPAQVLWSGRQWRIVPGFLDAPATAHRRQAYDIEFDRLGMPFDGPAASLHAHLITKRWVDFDDFCAAYRKAVEIAGTAPHDIDAMEAEARRRLNASWDGPA